MSYALPVKPFATSKPDWYSNSFKPISKRYHRTTLRFAELWEAHHGHKLQFNEWGFVKGVEFPDEMEAMAFVLRWS